MFVHRLCRSRFVALDGEGARRFGGRWNSAGRPVIYAASTLSLAALEYLVHLDASDAPNDLVAVTIEIPDHLTIDRLDKSALPPKWNESVDVSECRLIGDKWFDAANSPVLAVPAAPVPTEWNFLINSVHPEAARILVVNEHQFHFDPRLLG